MIWKRIVCYLIGHNLAIEYIAPPLAVWRCLRCGAKRSSIEGLGNSLRMVDGDYREWS